MDPIWNNSPQALWVQIGSKSSLHIVSAIQASTPVLSPYLASRLNASEKEVLFLSPQFRVSCYTGSHLSAHSAISKIRLAETLDSPLPR